MDWMKKFFLLTMSTVLTINILAGCEAPPKAYDVNKNVTITDVQIAKMDSGGAKIRWHKIWLKKDGKETEMDVDDYVYSDIEDILKTAKMLGKEKEVLFDFVVDGDKIVSVTLTTNRK